jgi:3-hydroxyacyl-CoA dehydrogenase
MNNAVGVIGLGIMGGAISANLASGGSSVVPLDFSQEAGDWGSLGPISELGQASNLHVSTDDQL